MKEWVFEYFMEILFVACGIAICVCIVLLYLHLKPRQFCDKTGCYEIRTTCLQYKMVTGLQPISVPASKGGVTTTWVIHTYPQCTLERIDTIKIK